MPQLNDQTQQYLRDAEAGVRRNTAWAWDSFTNFALRDNVLEVAVGLIIATTLTTLTTSLVTDILLPLISLLPFLSHTLAENFVTLKHGAHYNSSLPNGYNTHAQAISDGAVVFAYGSFIDKLVRFFFVAFALWGIAVVYGKTTKDEIVKRQVKCTFCRKYVSEKARRCVNCTSWLDGREQGGRE